MAYHDDLLRLAWDLIEKKPQTQAGLRRAVSTAYYALFHLLVNETTLNWSRESSRNTFGRMFDHGLMKRVSNRIADSKKTPYGGENPIAVSGLRFVAKAFVELQDKRHTADYDNGVIWSPLAAVIPVTSAENAFGAWRNVKNTDIAQEYLVSLLIRPRD